MTEFEFQRARKDYERQTRKTLWDRVKGLWSRLFDGEVSRKAKRRAMIDRKVEIERKARQQL